jgi:CRP-like cAMP-binding protein
MKSYKIDRNARLKRSVTKAVPNDEQLTSELLQQNFILRGLHAADASTVLKRGELLNLEIRQRIYEPEKTILEVYFPLNAVLSIVTHMEDGNQIEIGTIGREGMSAFPLLMGASATANDCYCQVPGRVIKISVKLFRDLSLDTSFRQLLDRYLQAYVNMLGQLAACNRLHSVYERCARWLLTTHDRVDSDEIALTHEYLAMMLGTGRSGVTIAAATLQQAGFIRYSRGTITILDRLGLEDASCECYKATTVQFGGLLRFVESEATRTRRKFQPKASPFVSRE